MMDRQTRAELIDGIDTLRRRDRSRLWYRQHPQPVKTLPTLDAVTLGRPASADRISRSDLVPTSLGTDRLTLESVSRSANLQKALDEADAVIEKPQVQSGADALTAWRDAPTHCPVLLLSASPILDARNPGPILGPGARYRVHALNDGVATLEVAALDGQVGIGYCNAIDLTCFVPDIAHLRREGGANVRQTARLNLNRISQRLSGVTAALIG